MVVLKECETQNRPNKLQLLQWTGQGKGEDHVKDGGTRLKRIWDI